MADRITSRRHAIVARIRAARRGDDADRVLLDGIHLVSDAAAAGRRLETALVASASAGDPQVADLVARLEALGVQVAFAAPAVMEAASPVRSPSPVVAIGERPRWTDDEVYRGCDPLVVIAADIQDPGNLGAIVRVAEAAGASGLVAAGAAADPFGWKALRGSMGSALRLPIVVSSGIAAAVDVARRRGCRVAATSARDGQPLFAAKLTGPLAVLVGSEGAGLPAPIVSSADVRITIPMAAPVESLNTAVAAALVVYEARRQRHELAVP